MTWAHNSRRRHELPPNWNTIRHTILTRDHYTCVICGQPANQVDHIGNRHDHTPTNLRSLCEPCHHARTSAQGGSAPRHSKLRKNQPQPKHPGLL